ncbi:hypothetical protein LC20_03921 [Yersinia hibernica]|uniref:Uncharacterized protein n=2 Tax=Yersinia TaxID=629 RepID=A0A7U4GH19_YEREN|nr:hypothetical protein LC20_03921 [Yersinia hibernica]
MDIARLFMPNKNKQHLEGGDEFLGAFDGRVNSAVIVNFVIFKIAKKLTYGALIVFSSGFLHVNAKQPEIIFSESRVVPFPLPTFGHELIEQKEERISNGIELLTLIPASGEPVTEPSSQHERNHTPSKSGHTQNETNDGRISVEESHELTPEGAHKFNIFLLINMTIFVSAFLLSAYFSMRRTLRRDWAKHMPKGQALKVPTMGMISILCVPRRIKSRSWQMWEQRQWFRDMKACHGLAVAYRDSWYWKRSVKATNDQ